MLESLVQDYTIDWSTMSRADCQVLQILYDLRNDGGLAEDCHCASCDCENAEGLPKDQQEALRSLVDRRIAYHDRGDGYGLIEEYEPAIEARLHQLAIERAERRMTPVFPEFQAQFKKEDTAHVG